MSHVSLAAMLLCRENNVILIYLPAHSSHILQPLDRGVYCHVKQVWKAVITKYLDKEKFPPLLKQVYESGKCFTRLLLLAFNILGFFHSTKKEQNKHASSQKRLINQHL